MTPKAARFVKEYLIDLNATKAAERAGYSKKTAYSAGQRLLKHVEVAAAIEKAAAKRAEKTDITAERVLRELGLIGFGDLKAIFDDDGRLRPMHELPESVSRTLGAVEVRRETVKRNVSGDIETDVTEQVIKVRSWDKIRALELLGRHLALWNEKLPGADEVEPLRIEITRRHASPSHAG
jgi:phage terminase small subunit